MLVMLSADESENNEKGQKKPMLVDYIKGTLVEDMGPKRENMASKKPK